MIRIRPKYYPHRGAYAYTRRGFACRVRSRLHERGFTAKQISRLEDLYFCIAYHEHQDPTGAYRNTRQYRLYSLSRKLKGDRKRPLFELVERSSMFFCFYDDDGKMVAFVSPRAAVVYGAIPLDRL